LKKYFTTFVLLVSIAACRTGSNNAPATDDTVGEASSSKNVLINDPKNGRILITKYDCATCHTTEKKIIGPAFRDVANRYAGNDTAVTYLAKKVINGGGGAWGTVPMSKHVNLSESDAEQIVTYVLSLKTK
jgi:cytochrome c